MRGEKTANVFHACNQRGSPPRARGEVWCRPRKSVPHRITPACAGRSDPERRRTRRPRDHPRVRGEKQKERRRFSVHKGSPPRARGEGFRLIYGQIEQRITPACAGRRTRKARSTGSKGDHPRVRGEKYLDVPEEVHCDGSPPRARGEAGAFPFSFGSLRITPACAGRSAASTSMRITSPDHPRVRGEKMRTRRLLFSISGSPPRARGEGVRKRRCGADGGITPACAGRRQWGRAVSPAS